jgi:hypothetical protein
MISSIWTADATSAGLRLEFVGKTHAVTTDNGECAGSRQSSLESRDPASFISSERGSEVCEFALLAQFGTHVATWFSDG